MGYLFLCIVANVGLFLIFRAFTLYKVNAFQAVTVNYIWCVITGIIFGGVEVAYTALQNTLPWAMAALMLGGVFLGGFYLMALSTRLLGVTVTTVASKMALAVPVFFGLFVFDAQSKSFNLFNYIGVVLALVAIVLSTLKPGEKTQQRKGQLGILLLPLSVFIVGGLLDTSINYINLSLMTPKEAPAFPTIAFFSAAVLGIIVLLFKGEYPNSRSMIAGTVLGIVNYFTIYALVEALNTYNNDGALVYPLVNIGIIVVSSPLAFLLFKEKLVTINYIGLVMAILAVVLISW